MSPFLRGQFLISFEIFTHAEIHVSLQENALRITIQTEQWDVLADFLQNCSLFTEKIFDIILFDFARLCEFLVLKLV